VLPFRAAVTTAVSGVATEPAVAVKWPVVELAATVALAGTVRLTLLLVKLTTTPPAGAGPLNMTVHALVPGPVKEDGAHVRALTVTVAGTVTVPPDPDDVLGHASAMAALVFETLMGRDRAPPVLRVSAATAIGPS
jgi:hypothetical protein